VVGYFVLPDSSWWSNYYLPIQAKLPQLKAKYQSDKESLAVVEAEELEIKMFQEYSKYYGYVFYVMPNAIEQCFGCSFFNYVVICSTIIADSKCFVSLISACLLNLAL
jgi:hypothetical protein